MPSTRDEWLSPVWCDWRWRIYGCQESDTWKALYIFSAVLLGILLVLGTWILFQKHRDGRLKLYTIRNGGFCPAGVNVFLITCMVFFIGRLIHIGMVLSDSYRSQVAAEFMHEWPWEILFIGVVMFTISCIYLTPNAYVSSKVPSTNSHKGRRRPSKRKPKEEREKEKAEEAVISDFVRVHLPSPRTLNCLLILHSIAPLATLPALAALCGSARDGERWAQASKLSTAQHALWAIYCWSLSSILLGYGVSLVRILQDTGKSIDRTGGDSFAQAIRTLIITVACLMVTLVVSGVILTIYGFIRVPIHTTPGVNHICAFIWICLHVFLVPILLVMAYNTRNDQKKNSEQSSPGSSKSDQTNSATVPTDRATLNV
ncbi:hypothetical protein DFS34DRAFT_615406 [Phlyctochytrium arcticum]|nr:hypothetical protein DFS34DRAFT_615406 [Phlyctochytrium arcticum]